jgi:hypothetical protein
MGERDECEPAQDVAEGERQRVVRRQERSERPQEADGEHLRPRSVVGTADRSDRPRDREDRADDRGHGDGDVGLTEVARDEEVEDARIRDRAETDGDDESLAAQRSERTAAPDRSAFAMNPRAPLERIRPL